MAIIIIPSLSGCTSNNIDYLLNYNISQYIIPILKEKLKISIKLYTIIKGQKKNIGTCYIAKFNYI